jgi:hypothetical protein
MTVTVTDSGAGKLAVKSPYHPDFSGRAKKIGGRWSASAKVWSFDKRDEERVRKLLVDLFGTDGTPALASDLLTIRAPATVCEGRHCTFGGSRPMTFWLAGREVARVSGRDSGAKLGDGVILLTGKFFSAGSVKSPACEYKDGTIVEVRDVPRAAAEKVHAEYHGVTLLDTAGNVVAEPTIEEDTPPPEPVADLSTQAALLTRLADVSTADLAAVLAARLVEAGRGDLAGIVVSALSENLKDEA